MTTRAGERGRSARLRRPGQDVEPGRETHRISPGGLVAVSLEPGDLVEVVDTTGQAVAELTLLDAAGRPAGVPGLAADVPASVLRSVASTPPQPIIAGTTTAVATFATATTTNSTAAAASGAARLRDRGADPGEARAARLFGPGSPRAATVRFTAEYALTCVVGVPGGRMEPDGSDPPSSVTLVVRRTAPPAATAEPELPPPLADPLFEARVDRCTALAYEVPTGTFVQIIDVAGRQCSDFLAFGAHQLSDGEEMGLDLTATRYFTGSAYPRPGLAGKFYGPHMQPLLEVVQDTVGRHDTFGLACNAKYYADLGYPGHANCSDNFNAALAGHGVRPRLGWAALNLFYNTFLDDAARVFFDEPWSRPGDYVLFRALADLVCASSACPDDVDPANGWEPTDVHVRVYPSDRPFQVAIARRATPDAEPVLTRRTGFHPRTSALARRMTEYRGFWLPEHFDGYGPHQEYWACRERAAVMDLSPLRKYEVVGPDAETLLQAVVTRDVRRLAVGQVVYTALCYETGGMVDDATVFRMGPDAFRFVGGDDYDGVWLREQADRLGLDRVWVKESTDQLHNIAIQGPASRELLASVVWTPPDRPGLTDIGWFRFTVGRLGGPTGPGVLVSRTGYSGELGYEVFCHPDDAVAVWDAVWEAGVPHGLAPLGLTALDMIRIEAGLAFAGHEFDDQVDPFEAGIGFTVPLKTKAGDFVGRAALERRKAHPSRVLVGLDLAGNEPAGHGDCVHHGRAAVGVVTSGVRSPVLRRNIALARVAVEYAEPGTDLEIGKLDGHAKRIPARVVRFPFYDPDKTRPRS